MNKHVINGSVQLPPVEAPVMVPVKLIVDKLIDGSIRSREEIVPVRKDIADRWIAAGEAATHSVAVETAALVEESSLNESDQRPRARKKKSE